MSMIPALWTKTIHGGIAMVGDDFIVTTPRFGDGNWRGGWWAKYDRQTGECIWRRKYRRGAELFDRIGDILIATTYKNSGVYAISLASGRHVWSRLGDRFDWLLRCFDFLPCDNEGDGPKRIWNEGVLTQSGRLLDAKTGQILSRHHLEYSNHSTVTLLKIDGNSVSETDTFRTRTTIDLHKQKPGPIEGLLAKHRLGLASHYPCAVCANGMTVCLACRPPAKFLEEPRLRLSADGSTEEVPHYLIVSDLDCTTILKQFDLGLFYQGELDWADDTILSITAQTRRQWSWTYQRQVWVIEWQALKKC